METSTFETVPGTARESPGKIPKAAIATGRMRIILVLASINFFSSAYYRQNWRTRPLPIEPSESKSKLQSELKAPAFVQRIRDFAESRRA